MMAEAFLEAGAVLEREDCTQFAVKTLERLWSEGYVPGNGMPHRLQSKVESSKPKGPWLLDDQVQAASYVGALDFLLNGECRMVVPDTTTTSPLTTAARAAYRPRRVLVSASASPVPGTPAPVALVCAGTACAAPVTTPQALLETLE